MCIIVDTNVMSSVLDKNNEDYSPVFDWVINGNGKFVFGGTKYSDELKKNMKFSSVLLELKRLNKVCIVDKKIVDELQKQVENAITDADFDDPHLIAITIATKCKLICSDDKRADKFLKDSSVFRSFNASVPLIYRKKSHKNLLCDSNIVEYCKPKQKLNKIQKDRLRLS